MEEGPAWMDACIAKGRVTRIVQTHSPRSSPRDTLPSPVRSVKTSASRERSRRAMAENSRPNQSPLAKLGLIPVRWTIRPLLELDLTTRRRNRAESCCPPAIIVRYGQETKELTIEELRCGEPTGRRIMNRIRENIVFDVMLSLVLVGCASTPPARAQARASATAILNPESGTDRFLCAGASNRRRRSAVLGWPSRN